MTRLKGEKQMNHRWKKKEIFRFFVLCRILCPDTRNTASGLRQSALLDPVPDSRCFCGGGTAHLCDEREAGLWLNSSPSTVVVSPVSLHGGALLAFTIDVRLYMTENDPEQSNATAPYPLPTKSSHPVCCGMAAVRLRFFFEMK